MITIAPALADARSSDSAPPGGAPGRVAWYAESFSDALGDRLRLFDNAGPPLELLRFTPSASAVDGFEAALRARVEALAAFRHPAFTRIRTVTTLDDPAPQLALVSELAAGERLAMVLQSAQASGRRLDLGSAVWLLRHLLPALSALHEATGGREHTLLDADRVVVTPGGEVIITEYVFGGLLGEAASRPGDVHQAALLAMGVMLGRPVRVDDPEPARIVGRACAAVPAGDVLRPWLLKAVSPPPEGFGSAREAYHALEELLPGVWGAWPMRQLAAGGDEPVALAPASSRTPAPSPGATVFREAQARPPAEIEVRRLSRRSRVLAAAVVAEAVVIAVLVARATAPSPVPPPVQAAGLVPPRVELPAPAAPSAPPAAPGANSVASARPASAASASPAVAAPPARPAAARSVTGWLHVEAPTAVKVYANGRLLGLSELKRFGLPEGEHTITFAHEETGFRSSQLVRIAAGKSVLLSPRPPETP